MAATRQVGLRQCGRYRWTVLSWCCCCCCCLWALTKSPLVTAFSTTTTQPNVFTRTIPSRVVYNQPISSLLRATKSDDDDDDTNLHTITSAAATDLSQPSVRLYPQRWVQLAILSLLALLSDWICFSVAAVPDVFQAAYGAHHGSAASFLLDVFLFTNVASCLLVTDIVAKIGLQRAVQAAAVIMTVGCWLRSGVPTILPQLDWFPSSLPATSHALVNWPAVVLGTVLVGAAQPFFQCTPPLLSAQWFGRHERAVSTAVALNFNQIGIANAFLVGGSMVHNAASLERYFGVITILCTIVATVTLVWMQNKPTVPPSGSALEKSAHPPVPIPFYQSVLAFFQTRGFAPALAAFVCSLSITNMVGAFLEPVLRRGGITSQFQIDGAGAGFELAILVGGILIGGYVDRTKQYKTTVLWSLLATSLLVIPLGLTEHAIGKEPVLLVLSLLGLGLAAGPVQPVTAELAVDVTYPGDETAVESVQQVGGNLVSALLVPVAEWASQRDFSLSLPRNSGFPSTVVSLVESDIRGDVVLLLTIAVVTMIYFSGFNAPLSRSLADDDEQETEANSLESTVLLLPNKRVKVDAPSLSPLSSSTTTNTMLG